MIISEMRVGEKIEIKAIHEGQAKPYQIVIAERKDKETVADVGKSGNFGMTVQDITPEIAKYLGIARKSGVIVVEVKEGSPADEAGIRPQDVIIQVNKAKITSLKDYEREIAKISGKEGVLLLIRRGNISTF